MSGEAGQTSPTGTVAFLFTDIAGSTRRWAAEPEAMATAVERHDEIVRRIVQNHEGYVFATGGDSFAVAFWTSADAVEAAVEIQAALKHEVWSTAEAIAVRIGINLGVASERGGDYFGPAVNLAARVEAVGHPGQVLLTDAVAQTCALPCADLGEHQLKDIERPTRLFQVGSHTFPPLRTLARVHNTLPSLRTVTVGREEFIRSCRLELATTRLLTLTGVGGTGKTRAAVEVATAALHDFPDGVFFADLTAVDTDDRLWPAVQSAIGLVAEGDPRDRVVDFLGSKRVLLVWDNCEQVIDDVADAVDDLLESTTTPVVLATSRENLDLPGERVVRVPGLTAAEAKRLFVERAHDVGSMASVEDDDAIALICEQLDGIPLAIELAAARCASMSPIDIAGRLDERFTLLGSGTGRRRRRQQTLAGVMDWSHQLLSDAERVLFRRLAVFVGGFDLDDVAAVTAMDRLEVEPLLESLRAKSLIDTTRAGAAVDLRLLESTRLYALDRLVAAGEAAEFREAHGRHFGLAPLAITFDKVRTQSPESAARELRRANNTEAALAHLVATGRHSEAAALVTTRSLGFIETGRLSAYRDLFLDDHSHAPESVQLRVFAGSGVWAAHADFEVVAHLANASKQAASSLRIPPGHEALSGWVWLAAMTEGMTEALALADSLLDATGGVPDASAVGSASLHMYRVMGLSMLGQFVEAADAGVAGYRASPDSTSGLACATMAIWFLIDDGRATEAFEIAASLPAPRPGAFAYLTSLARVMARIGTDPDLVVAFALVDLCSGLVPGRVPSQEGDFLPAFAKLRLRRGDDARAREIADGFLVKVLGAPANHLISTLQGWPDTEREARGRQLAALMLDPKERRRRQQANIEMLAEEVAFWRAEVDANPQAEMGVPE